MSVDAYWLAYLALGAFVGIVAGMLGLGGGAFMVPLLVWLFDRQGLPRDSILHLALGTSMACMAIVSLGSARAHTRRGSIDWPLARRFGLGAFAGGMAGPAIARLLDTGVLALLFTSVVYAVMVLLVLDVQPRAARGLPGAWGLGGVGFSIGTVAALVSIGGAALGVPYMMYCNVPVLTAVGTAAAVSFAIALAGTLGYVISGWHLADLPAATIGYVYWPAVIPIALASVLTAPAGATIAHVLPRRMLVRCFAGLLCLVATGMLVKFV